MLPQELVQNFVPATLSHAAENELSPNVPGTMTLCCKVH